MVEGKGRGKDWEMRKQEKKGKQIKLCLTDVLEWTESESLSNFKLLSYREKATWEAKRKFPNNNLSQMTIKWDTI